MRAGVMTPGRFPAPDGRARRGERVPGWMPEWVLGQLSGRASDLGSGQVSGHPGARRAGSRGGQSAVRMYLRNASVRGEPKCGLTGLWRVGSGFCDAGAVRAASGGGISGTLKGRAWGGRMSGVVRDLVKGHAMGLMRGCR